MQLANSIMGKWSGMRLNSFLSVLFLSSSFLATAQSNSPYSRYGLGDLVPQSNITTRGMGGISAAYADRFSINFNNPASYAWFEAPREANSKKLQYGRVVLDAGLSVENRTLIAPNTVRNFSSADPYFNYIQVGIPLRQRWGLSFGIRPLTRIGYRINRFERLRDPNTNDPIDSAVTQFTGSGGGFLPTIGTGFSIGKHLTVGANIGYLFGRRELSTRRSLINDTVLYYASESATDYSFGGLFYTAGVQYNIPLKGNKNLRLGVSGNWNQDINASSDLRRITYALGASGETLQIDSVLEQRDVKGKITYPATYTAGFLFSDFRDDGRGLAFGVDYSQGRWSSYRFFGQPDAVQDSWKIAAGAQFNPRPIGGYFSKVAYRAGVSFGQDYIRVDRSMPTFGASFGMTLPIRISRLAPNQLNGVNLAFEYLSRGNNENQLKESVFRFSLGFNFTDLWFIKRKYD
jgi:hypothetical protein